MRHRQSQLVIAGLFVFVAAAAFGASVHFKPKSPVFTDTGVTLLTEGTLAGLSNADILITVDAVGVPVVLCTNSGGNKAPGQNPGEIETSGALKVNENQIKNGEYFFSLSTAAPVAPSGRAAGCPNDGWKVSITDVDFTAATITVYQAGVIVLQESFEL